MMEQKITSRKNPLLQEVRKLISSRKEREKTGLYVSDGTKLLSEAIKWDSGLCKVFLSEELELPALPEGVELYRLPKDVLESISPMETPQGAVFVCKKPEKQAFSMTAGTLVLDGIQDPGNLGTILRTADAMEIPVVLTDGCADPYGWKAVRASMGAVFRTHPVQVDAETLVSYCREQGIPLAAAALTDRAEDIRRQRLLDCAVVIGSEGQGVRPELLSQSDRQLIIPMNARCESLNAAIAAAIVLWQMKLEER